MKLEGKAWLCAIILVAFALFLLPSSAGAQTRSAAESLDGQWLTDGYGGFIELQGDTLRRYESAINANEAVIVDDDGAMTFAIWDLSSD